MTATEARAVSDEEAIKQTSYMTRLYAERLSRHDRSVHDDLIQEGRLGALDAARTFKPGLGWQFTSYARFRVIGRMKDYLRSVSPMCRREMVEARETGEKPFRVLSLSAAHVGSERDFGGSMGANQVIRFDPPHHDPEPSDDTGAELLAMLRRRGVRLHRSEARLIRWHYGRGLTQKAISERLGVHETRISQRLKAITDHLREHCHEEEQVRSYSHDRYRFKPVPVVVRERGERVNGVDEGVMLEDLELRVVTRSGEGEKEKLVVVCPRCGGHRRVTMRTVRTWYCTHDGVPACTPQTCRRVRQEATA